MNNIRSILLAEDSHNDAELTLEALAENNIANRVIVVKDGVEAMEYLQYQGKFRMRKHRNPAVTFWILKCPG